MKTVTLAHYYTTPEVQALADKVGDSLELSLFARDCGADRIVFAGVRFMAETAKIINPAAEVILPHAGSTCSLVEQTNIAELREWVTLHSLYSDAPSVHVSYINSSAEHKAISDWIVTSANVEEIVTMLMAQGKRVLFSPDRNMGAYLAYSNPQWFVEKPHSTFGQRFKYWSAVCEVHDKFKEDELELEFRKWTDGPKFLIAHPESPLPVLKRANMVGSTSKMLKWIQAFNGSIGTIYVATEDGLLFNMRQLRPDLDIRQAPIYAGCQCNSCPYMKYNQVENIKAAIAGVGGTKIDYLSTELMDQARTPIERMLNFNLKG
jgi:quinolinate synthase